MYIGGMRLRRAPGVQQATASGDDRVDPLRAVEDAAAQLARAKDARDNAIGWARAERVGLQRIAKAADLSVSRVKQISTTSHETMYAPVTEVDLQLPEHDPWGDRVLGIDDVDPFVTRWASERAFIDENDDRRQFADITKVLDLGTDTWSVCYSIGTRELYAWAAQELDPTYEGREAEGTASPHGPCILLGHVISFDVAVAAIANPGNNLAHRPGGLAWVYGRVRMLNSMLRNVLSDYSIRGELGLIEYLDDLPESEKR